MHRFTAPWWLPGGHAQTIWPAKLARPGPGQADRKSVV
jgi:predicted alpha/beta-fold hydrolase